MRRIFVGITGASGVVYGISLVKTLAAAGVGIDLTVSASGVKVLRHERGVVTEHRAPDLAAIFGDAARAIRYHSPDRVEAPVSSGTYGTEAAVICPCSMGTLGSIASGASRNLVTRVADVMLKEGRPLVLVPRETPLSLVHLRNMVRVAEAGAVVLPAAPGFYHGPETIDDLVMHVVTKITDRLGLRLDLIDRWGED